MPRYRDPLSTEYDDFSQTFLAVCLDDPGGWHTASVRSPAGDPIDARGLSKHERALTRSLYYVLNSTSAEGPLGGRWLKNEDWSLQIGGWSRPAYSAGIISRILRAGSRRRILTARIVSGSEAYAYARDELPPGAKYTENPGEQAQALELGA